MNTTIIQLRISKAGPLSRSRFIWLALALGYFALLPPKAFGVVPPPDGGYPGNNTAEGDNALLSLTTGIDNTGIGYLALQSNTTGSDNTAIGAFALASNTTGSVNTATGSGALEYNTTGFFNTANGFFALFRNTTGTRNTASGSDALLLNTTGSDNTGIGHRSLENNTTGFANTATGRSALSNNTTGAENTGNGWRSLSSNTTGSKNTANGLSALASNTTGFFNTASGALALASSTTGFANTATGFRALEASTTSIWNTATGAEALLNNTTGSFNTADGLHALVGNSTGSDNTAIGVEALRENATGNSNIALGAGAGDVLTTGSNNIDIGNHGVPGESNTIRIGTVGVQTATYVAGILGKTVPMSVPVFVNASGLLGTVPSSARFKHDIKSMHEASEAILALNPVTFHYKSDKTNAPQFGLVAEEVAEVSPDLVVRDEKGEIYTVRYEAVNAMLLNEFLKEHQKVQELESTVAKQEAAIAEQDRSFQRKLTQQETQIEALTLGLQKVSAQMEMMKPATQVVVSGP
jgi:hypothetical protein